MTEDKLEEALSESTYADGKLTFTHEPEPVGSIKKHYDEIRLNPGEEPMVHLTVSNYQGGFCDIHISCWDYPEPNTKIRTLIKPEMLLKLSWIFLKRYILHYVRR